MRRPWRVRGCVASQRRARIRLLALPIHRPRPIYRPARAFPNPRIDLGSFPFRVRKMVLLLVRARLGARNLAAARPTENSHRRRCGEQPFASCLLRGILICARPLVAPDSPLHRAHTVRFVLDGGNRRLLGGTASAGSARSPLDKRGRGDGLAPPDALALAGASRSGDFDRGGNDRFVPIVAIAEAPRAVAKYWYEAWPDEPELRKFLASNIGLRADPRFRGSAFFYTFGYDEFLTLDSLWADGVPTTNEYSQLVIPQSIYFIHRLFKRNQIFHMT